MKLTEVKSYLIDKTEALMHDAGLTVYRSSSGLQGVWQSPLDDGVEGTIDLGNHIKYGTLTYYFWVGIRINEIEDLFEKLMPKVESKKASKKQTDIRKRATVITNSGYESPSGEYIVYTAYKTQDIDRNLNEAFQTALNAGRNYIQKFGSRELFYGNEDIIKEVFDEARAVIYFKLGKYDLLSRIVHENFFASPHIEMFERHRIFGKNLLELIEQQEPGKAISS